MKIKKQVLKSIISEVLEEVLKEEETDLQNLQEIGFGKKIRNLAGATALAAGLASGAASAEPPKKPAAFTAQVGDKSERAFRKTTGEEVNINALRASTINIQKTTNKSTNEILAQHIKDVESFGGKVTKISTSFTFVKEINGKTVTFESISVQEQGKRRSLTIIQDEKGWRKLDALSPEFFEVLQDYVSVSDEAKNEFAAAQSSQTQPNQQIKK